MVLIWDGGEGGGHNTWDYLHVWDEPDDEAPESAEGSPTPEETSGPASAAVKRSSAADKPSDANTT